MQAAIYSNGQVHCGITHGHAASRLADDEKDKALSGWYDDTKKKFVYDDRFLYAKEIILVRHAHAVNDHLTRKGIAQITSSLKSMSVLYKPGLQIYSSPTDRCEHTAYLLSNHFSVPGFVDDNLGEPATDETVNAGLDALPDCCIAVTHSDFIRKAIAKITGTLISYIPNLCLMRLSGNHLDDMVFYADDQGDE